MSNFFKGTSSLSDHSFNEVLEHNVISYIDWNMLRLGGFSNVEIPTSGNFGGDAHQLRRVTDPRYTDGQVWEGFRKNWVWESGIGHATSPISISGVFVNASFFPINSGYHIDYPNGRIVFDSPLPASSSVKVGYSFKWVNTVSSDQVPFFRQGHTRSFRIDESHYTANSGIWNRLTDTRLELPLIAVEAVQNKTYAGYQLGGGQFVRPKVLLHVISEDKNANERLASILSEQAHSTLFMYDSNKMGKEGAYPLDYRGSKTSNPLTYPDLIRPTGDSGYRYTSKVKEGRLFISRSTEQSTERITQNIYHSVVEWELEAILFAI